VCRAESLTEYSVVMTSERLHSAVLRPPHQRTCLRHNAVLVTSHIPLCQLVHYVSSILYVCVCVYMVYKTESVPREQLCDIREPAVQY